MKISKTENEISFTFPLRKNRLNPFGSDEENEKGMFGTYPFGTYPTFTGLIVHNRKNNNNFDEMGFAGTIDMSYKDKGDQVGDFIVKWSGSEEDFIEKCKELGFDIHIIEN